MSKPKPAVPFSLRLGSFLLSAALTGLFIQLLAFVLNDIGDMQGPSQSEVLARYEDGALKARAQELADTIDEIDWSVERQGELQDDLRRSMDNARDTMQQMLSLQRLALEQGLPPSEQESEAVSQAQQLYLDAQGRFEEANAEIAASNARRYQLKQELKQIQDTLADQREPALDEYRALRREHEFKLASYKLAFIVPLFLLSAFLFFRKRGSPYRAILIAGLASTFWMVGRVMLHHFPQEYFKYIAIVAVTGIVLAFLVWLLRKATRPGRDLLLSRYREAYRAHLCPVCAYPIARGPLRFAVWTRKGPRPTSARTEAAPAHPPATSESAATADAPYGCPSCGTSLFAPCGSCGGLRHTLLPFCERCGDEAIEGPLAAAG